MTEVFDYDLTGCAREALCGDRGMSTRVCLGCGGSGINPCGRGRYHRRGFCIEGGNGICGTCPACLGTGRQSDVIPARDAMVDAETLRRIAVDPWGRGYVLRSPYHNRLRRNLSAAQGPCVYWSDGWGTRMLHDLGPSVVSAARAAFRAVPALRGEGE